MGKDAPDKLFVVPARQVSAPDASAEKRVATPQCVFFLAVKTDAALAVPWCVNHPELVGPKADMVVVFQLKQRQTFEFDGVSTKEKFQLVGDSVV